MQLHVFSTRVKCAESVIAWVKYPLNPWQYHLIDEQYAIQYKCIWISSIITAITNNSTVALLS